MDEMGSWCIFNDDNKPHNQTATQALLFKMLAGRMHQGFHLKLTWVRGLNRFLFFRDFFKHLKQFYEGALAQ